jgi:hypothetical protein
VVYHESMDYRQGGLFFERRIILERSEFDKCCKALDDGREIHLENVVTRSRGKLLFCTADRFHVEVDGSRDSWLPQICDNASA